MSENDRHSGGCRCGAIRYSVSGPTIWSAGCCCRDCARTAGTPYVVWVGFPPEKVMFSSNKPMIHTSSEGVLRGFCASCGSTLTYGRDPAFEAAESTLYVSAATLDEPDAYPPTEVVWYGQRPGWFELAPGIPLHETISPDNANRAYSVALKNR